MSHPQALAQCDNYLRAHGMRPEPKYDTAGSAKHIQDQKDLGEEGEDMEGCAAIASDLAGKIYDMDVVEANIEDDDNNYTRFILLSRAPYSNLIAPGTPSKTTMVFLIDHSPGALYRALACFALRDIDLSKCESRPTSVQLLKALQLNHKSDGAPSPPKSDDLELTHASAFNYCFYLDIGLTEVDTRTQAAIYHLKEQSKFVRVLGSYPSESRLVGPIQDSLKALEHLPSVSAQSQATASYVEPPKRKLQIGIIGFGKFGQVVVVVEFS